MSTSRFWPSCESSLQGPRWHGSASPESPGDVDFFSFRDIGTNAMEIYMPSTSVSTAAWCLVSPELPLSVNVTRNAATMPREYSRQYLRLNQKLAVLMGVYLQQRNNMSLNLLDDVCDRIAENGDELLRLRTTVRNSQQPWERELPTMYFIEIPPEVASDVFFLDLHERLRNANSSDDAAATACRPAYVEEVESSDAAPWACGNCTYENHAIMQQCELCEAPNEPMEPGLRGAGSSRFRDGGGCGSETETEPVFGVVLTTTSTPPTPPLLTAPPIVSHNSNTFAAPAAASSKYPFQHFPIISPFFS